MKKRVKAPHMFGRCKAKTKQRKQQQTQSRVLDEKTIQFLEWLSPGFAQ